MNRVWAALAAVLLTAACKGYTTDENLAGTCTHARTGDDLIKYCNAALDNRSYKREFYPEAEVYNARGLGYLLKKEYDLALADFETAISKRGYETVLYINRGDAYLGKKDYDRAIADYNYALGKAPGAMEIYIHRGLAYLWKRDTSAALANFDQAVDLSGNGEAGALMFRALGYFATQDYPGATADFRKVLNLKPDAAAAEDGLCRSLAYEGRTFEAMGHCARALDNTEKPGGPLFARGYAKLRNGDWKAALADCGEPAGLAPVSAEALFCGAYAHERLGDVEAARSGYAAARAADSKVDEAMRRLGIVPGRTEIKPET